MAKLRDELKELRSMSEVNLTSRLKELHEKMRDFSFRTQAEEVKDMHQYQKTRRHIARVLTILNEKRSIKR